MSTKLGPSSANGWRSTKGIIGHEEFGEQVGAAMSDPRQALILIHGIGEQRPMETLRGFVDVLLDQQQTNSLADAKYYSKPDFLSDNFELRRLVSAGGHGDRTDFYEFYWAHLMPTAAWDRLAGWYWVLMYRRFADVPGRIKPIWILSWLVFAFFAVLGVYSSARLLLGYPIAPGVLDKAPWFLLLVIGILSTTVRSFIGDAAVYLSPTPANIEARQ
jgi:hypothetical protein